MDNRKIIEMGVRNAKSLPHPTTIKKDNLKVVKMVKPPTVQDSIVELLSITNPMEFLAKVVEGEPLPEYVVNEDGSVDTYYVTPTLAQRISVARFLTDKYIPKMTVNKHYHQGTTSPGHGESNYSEAISEAVSESEGGEGVGVLEEEPK